jgi:threonine dehydrogenase-like Zn-dependent dehydrogenase
MKALVFNLSIPRVLGLKLIGPLKPELYYRSPLSLVGLADVPEPVLPSADWVKIKTRMCGFCGSDLNLMFLKDSLMASPFTSFPAIVGHELCGEVVETGSDVHVCKTGELVTVEPMLGCNIRGITPECRSCRAGRPGNCENLAAGNLAPGMFMGICRDRGGGFAEYMVAHASQVHRVPDGVSAESATLTEPLAVALQAVLDNRPADGDKVLVIGGGVIGTMIVKALRGLNIPCDITVIEPSLFAAEYVKKSGANSVTSGGILETAEQVTGARSYKPLMGPPILQGGFERVYDTVGHSPTLQGSLIATAAGGTISLVGIGNKVTFDPTPLWLKLQTIKGVYAYGYAMTETGRKNVFELALELMQEGKIFVEDMLTHTFPIERYQDMIEVNLHKGKNRAMKTAVRF